MTKIEVDAYAGFRMPYGVTALCKDTALLGEISKKYATGTIVRIGTEQQSMQCFVTDFKPLPRKKTCLVTLRFCGGLEDIAANCCLQSEDGEFWIRQIAIKKFHQLQGGSVDGGDSALDERSEKP